MITFLEFLREPTKFMAPTNTRMALQVDRDLQDLVKPNLPTLEPKVVKMPKSQLRSEIPTTLPSERRPIIPKKPEQFLKRRSKNLNIFGFKV